MKPSDILQKRAECYRTLDPQGIFNLYAEASDFKRFFPDIETYVKNFNSLTIDHETPSLEIFREKESDDGTAEILFLETFKSINGVKQFYSKSTFVKEDGSWKILKEVREEKGR